MENATPILALLVALAVLGIVLKLLGLAVKAVLLILVAAAVIGVLWSQGVFEV